MWIGGRCGACGICRFEGLAMVLASGGISATFAGYANFIRTPAVWSAAFGQLLWDDGTGLAVAA